MLQRLSDADRKKYFELKGTPDKYKKYASKNPTGGAESSSEEESSDDDSEENKENVDKDADSDRYDSSLSDDSRLLAPAGGRDSVGPIATCDSVRLLTGTAKARIASMLDAWHGEDSKESKENLSKDAHSDR